jgi:hypothetical protein
MEIKGLRAGAAAALAMLGMLDAARAVAQVSSQPPVMQAGQPPSPPAIPTAALPDGGVTLTAGSVVEIELAQPVSSKTAKRGDTFAVRLVQPITVGGRVVAPAGAEGGGEVVYAQPGGLLASAGKLVLAARYLDVGGQRIRLNAFKLGGGGDDRIVVAFVAGELVGPLAILLPGGDIEFPAGTRANAKVAVDVVVVPPTAAAPLAAPASTQQTTTTREGTP